MNITEHLINYRFYLATIKTLSESIKVSRIQQDGQKGIDYSADQRSSNEVQSMVENTVINIMEKEKELQRLEVLVQAIDRALGELEEVDRQILELKYIEKGSYGISWEKIARQNGYDQRQCQRRNSKALSTIENIVLSGVV